MKARLTQHKAKALLDALRRRVSDVEIVEISSLSTSEIKALAKQPNTWVCLVKDTWTPS